MKVGLIGSHLSGLTARGEVGYETRQIQKACVSRGHHFLFIDPEKTTCGVNSEGCFARFASDEYQSVCMTELDVLIVRRTAGMIDEILDFLKFSQIANRDLLIVDPIESMGRPTSKVEAIAKRSLDYLSQPNTQVLRKIDDLDEDFSFPLVAKPMYGTGGKGVVRCENINDLNDALEQSYDQYSGYATIVQEDVTGINEYRVLVVNGKGLGCVSKPKPMEGIARNSTFVDEFEQYEGANRFKLMRFAERISLYMGQFLSGVDIIENDGRFYVIECNRNPQFENFDFATKSRSAPAIVEEIENIRHATSPKNQKRDRKIEESSVKKPTIFIGSSKEGLPVAEVLQWSLENSEQYETALWNQGAFKPSSTGFQSITKALEEYDFAIFCLTADDKTTYREMDVVTARDNVVFEAGLFIGALGADKVFLLVSTESIPKVPTDLNGVNLITWTPHSNGNLRSALGKAVVEIRDQMET